jgi:serine protease
VLAGTVAVALAASVAAVVAAAPSGAATPYTATGTLQHASTGIGVTDTEFVTSCPSMPATQGQDGWVFDLPANIVVAGAHVAVAGAPATYVLAAYLYDGSCLNTRSLNGTAGAFATDLASGERYVSVYTTTVGLSAVGLTLTVTPPDTASPTPTATASGSPSPSPTATPVTRGTYPLVPSDPLFLQDGSTITGGQWGMRTIHAPEAWQEARATGAGIKVAVIDSGLDLTHEDFACPGKVEIVPDADPDPDGNDLPVDDEEGHGTHVAGIIGACTNNGIGVVGVAPDSTIMPIQGLSSHVTDTVGTVARAIDTAVANGAHVVNMSIGFGATGQVGTAAFLTSTSYAPIDAAIERAVAAGVVVVAAAGNDTSPLCGYPAISEDVICVGSSDRRDVNSWFGNFPVKTDDSDTVGPALLAPGGVGEPFFCDFSAQDIISTYAVSVDRSEGDCDGLEGYATIEGTSMASPHVAGVAALVYDRIGGVRSGDNGRKVVAALLGSAADLYGPGYDPASGYGRVDALAAVRYYPAAADPSPTVSPTPTPVAQPTAVAFTQAAASGQFSDAAALEATLTDAGGHPLGGEPVTFQLANDGAFREVSATTDANGLARAALPLDVPPGAYDLAVGYAGKAGTWQTSSASRAFTVTREDSRTTLVTAGNGAKRTLTATVADADDAARRLAGVTVTFWADGKQLGSAVTDANGTASVSPPSGARGSGTAYQARFAGDTYYLGSTS